MNLEIKTNLKSQRWGSESSRTDGLVDTRVYKEVAEAKLTSKTKPNLKVAAMGVYKRGRGRPGRGGGRPQTLGRAPIGPNLITWPIGPKLEQKRSL